MLKIGFLGAGAMGSRLIMNLLKQNYAVTVYNRTTDKIKNLIEHGAYHAKTPAEAAEKADIVISMVRDDLASKEVWTSQKGAIQNLKQSAIAIESSTLSPEWIVALASTFSRNHASFLEAPVLGTLPQAESAQLIYLIGGEEETLNRAKPVLKKLSAAIHHIGEHGSASVFKLAVNAQYGTQVAIWSETLEMLHRYGISNQDSVRILNTLPTTSAAMKVAGDLIAQGIYKPLFPIDLVEKDFSYVKKTASNKNIKAGVIEAVLDAYRTAKASGYGDENIVAISKIYKNNN
jgi:3-hydroxyisobutyrate dehydrogenase